MSIEGVEAVSAVLEEKVFVSFAGQESIAVLKGVDRAYPEVIGVDSVLVAGEWLPAQERSDTAWHVVGISMAYRLGMGAAQEPTPLRVYVLSGGGNLSLVPENSFSRADTWTARGVFAQGLRRDVLVRRSGFCPALVAPQCRAGFGSRGAPEGRGRCREGSGSARP